jgi:hypothetical protein
MSLTPEERLGRSQKAARTRWHDTVEPTPEITQLEVGQVDKAVDILKASWRSATAEQKDRLRRLFNPPVSGRDASG